MTGAPIRVWAARLGRADDMKMQLQDTSDFQISPTGLAWHSRNSDPARGGGYYDAWNAFVATALEQSLVQSHQGVIRVTSAGRRNGTSHGTVQVEGGHRVSVDVRDCVAKLVGVQAGSSGMVQMANHGPANRSTSLTATAAAAQRSSHRPRPESPACGPHPTAPTSLQRVAKPCSSFSFARADRQQPATHAKQLRARRSASCTARHKSAATSSRWKPDHLHALVRAEPGRPTTTTAAT